MNCLSVGNVIMILYILVIFALMLIVGAWVGVFAHTFAYVFGVFAVLFLIGHWHVNIRKNTNTYESIFGAMLLIGLVGGIMTGIVAILWTVGKALISYFG
jgi:4-hydroxybenzoate polyprenyltransferase